jgi:hypothetical protein
MKGLRRWDPALPLVLQALPFAAALALENPAMWAYAFAFAAAVNLWAWLAALRKRVNILDTPTSRVASAAQGYVELIGRARPLAGGELLTPHSQLPCLWYRYRVLRSENNAWREVDSGESEMPFGLDDGSGLCELDPRGAEILTTHEETRTEGEYRHIEQVLLKGDRLYVLGDFASVNGAQLALDRRRDVGELLGDWKADKAELHGRFDLDGNGEIDAREWQLARLAADREVGRRHEALRRQPQRHLLRRPAHGRPYLISNREPDRLGRRYAWLAALHLALLVATLTGLGWSLERAG